MDWKHARDEREYIHTPVGMDKSAVNKLKMLAQWIDQFCLMMDWGQVVITSFYRPDDKDSYHSICQAADIRSKDKPGAFRTSIRLLSWVLKVTPGHCFQIYTHEELVGRAQEHIHLAWKDGKIERQ